MYGIETIKRINAEARASGLDIKAYHENLPPAIDVKTGEAVYLGHRPDGDPVQKHSAGPLYPFVFYRKGDSDYIMVGEVAVRVPSYATAEQLVAEARALKAQNASAGYPELVLAEALKRVAGINALPWEPFLAEAA
jgi:hypothetical protein